MTIDEDKAVVKGYTAGIYTRKDGTVNLKIEFDEENSEKAIKAFFRSYREVAVALLNNK